jgi:hypothetical protein
MPDLITLESAKAHLKVTTLQEDSDLQDKLDAATQIILDYLTRRDAAWNATINAWTADTVPRSVRQAILIQFGEFVAKRGDDPTIAEPTTPLGLSRTVMSLLYGYRDPGLA